MTKKQQRLKSKGMAKDERLRQSEERNARLQAFMNHSPSLEPQSMARSSLET